MSTYNDIRGAERATLGDPRSVTAKKPAPGSPWLRRALAGSLAIGFGAWLAVQMLPHWNSPKSPQAEQANSQRDTPVSPVVSAKETSDLGTFGTDSSIAARPSSIVLIRTIPGASPRNGKALFGVDPRNPQTFVTGALLANGSRLVEVHSNRIVLERNGARSTVFVAGIDVKAAIAASSAADGKVIDEVQRARLINGDKSIASIGAEPHALLEPGARPGSTAVGYIRGQVEAADGLVTGLRVLPGADAGTFSRLGFMSGDLIVAIDGTPVAGDASLFEFVKTLENGAVRNVTVQRGAAQQDINVDGANLKPNSSASLNASQPL